MVAHCNEDCHNHFNDVLIAPSFSHRNGHDVMADSVIASIGIVEHIDNRNLHDSSVVTEELIDHDWVLSPSARSRPESFFTVHIVLLRMAHKSSGKKDFLDCVVVSLEKLDDSQAVNIRP